MNAPRTVNRRFDDGWATRKNARGRCRPCSTGLHIAFHDDENNELVTIANIQLVDADAARAAFAIAALRFANVEADLVCDLRIDDDLIEVCELWRQDLEPLRRELSGGTAMTERTNAGGAPKR